MHDRLDAADPSRPYLERPVLRGEEDLWGTMTLHHPARDIRVRMVNRCTADVIRTWSELQRGADDTPDHICAMEALLEGGGVVMFSRRALGEVIGISWDPGES